MEKKLNYKFFFQILVRNLEKTFDLVLDNKGKTGVIEVVFNGIDPSIICLLNK